MGDVMLLNDIDLLRNKVQNHAIDPPIPQILEEGIVKGGIHKRNLALFQQNISSVQPVTLTVDIRQYIK